MTDINVHTADGITRFQGTAKKSTLGTETILDLDTAVDSTILILSPPDRSANTSITCTIVNAGSGDGLWNAATASAIFIGKAGRWRAQAKYNMTVDAVPLYSQIVTFTVQETLEDT
jgi:hypothetical protein